ncbi:MAG: sulfatase [Planctomycetaceae bacterium]|nr:sulfatase [Planctomycetaceae bacterium]
MKRQPLLSRREVLQQTSTGFGMLALSGLMADGSYAGLTNKLAMGLHHVAKAKHVIFCYMSGGVSHIDSFDPKPRLAAEAGKPMPMKVERTQFNNNGNIMPSPFPFKPAGQSGIPISSMFPQLATVADELAVVRSMTSPVNEHAQGNYFIHTGFPFMGHPSAGAWTCYGLGTENANLPGFVVLQSGGAVPPHGGIGLFSSGFLPAEHQASIVKADKTPAIRDIDPRIPQNSQRQLLDVVGTLDKGFSDRTGNADVEAAIRNYETAYRMQTSVPGVCDISEESAATRKLYGVDSKDGQKAAYARQCLLARRLVERGVRFVELSCLTEGIGAGGAANPWDQHGDLERGHAAMAYQIDQPIAALIRDLKSRGLLDETLIVWAGEFGRTPFSQGSNGRDHNPFGFSIWMAGGGVKGGTTYGATDEYGYHVTENPCTVFDLWATVLHQMGIDHERLTYRYAGRDVRLTDVHGNVLHDILS